ncbi:DNA-binding LacI/PurR family transcriptional regulator [Kribbella aluminosa]|uniref:DNA-binding LacI/PurR family transcriptional regulator n=1 Tax=Kribbella aluminosa TaxID=416017 RepID=A0ABS4UIX4_9ACTN|nr:LacI family DNA-binding transcriptional regulator [Kribbella aluminosa]MBP2351593.1 DNA-binding LacI/PurR family transcriptional regulator [Kribbella aluminosa]
MATISDVARAAGVSPSTVSRVLNQPEAVVVAKRDRVFAAIAELDYRPSSAARNLRRGSFDTLALLVGDISQPFHGALAKSVQRAADEHGYSLLLCDLDHSRDRLIGLLHSLPKRGVDGVIIATADNLNVQPVRGALSELLDQGVAVVCGSQNIRSLGVPALVTDRVAVARDATAHLLTQGLWPIVFLGGGPGSALTRDARKGYEQACRTAGRSDDELCVINGDYRAEAAEQSVGTLLDNGVRPAGIVADNTPMALGAARALTERGLTIPADVAIVSCEDVPLGAYLQPPLSSVRTDLEDYGRRIVDVLISAIAGQDVPARTLVPHHLVVRGSSS